MNQNRDRQYEVVIIGGGPAGLSAGLYTARARLRSIVVEKGIVGGQIINARLIENYPGFPEGIGGLELADLISQQAEKHGLETLIAEVTGIELKGEPKIVKTSEGNLVAKAVIIAVGLERSKLGVPGEAEFTGKGVSYCATCDGAFFRDQTIAVVGGGNAAINEALDLTDFAAKVIVLHRGRELRATRVLQEKALANPKIEFQWNTIVEAIEGEAFVKRLKLRDVISNEASTLDVAGIFVAIGSEPGTAYLKGLLRMDAAGYIITNEKMETNIPGVFAAGDVRSTSIRQTIAAAGDGAIAAIYAERFVRQKG